MAGKVSIPDTKAVAWPFSRRMYNCDAVLFVISDAVLNTVTIGRVIDGGMPGHSVFCWGENGVESTAPSTEGDWRGHNTGANHASDNGVWNPPPFKENIRASKRGYWFG